MFDFSPLNPFRVTSWRWERARHLLGTRADGTNRYKDDRWVSLALRFRRRLQACRTTAQHGTLFDDMPDLYIAHQVYSRESERDMLQKWELEARIMSAMPLLEIADRMGYMPEAVVAYERIFFNVLEKLRVRTYMLHQVMGPSVARGITTRQPDVLWKLFAYFGGPVILDELISTTQDLYHPENTQQSQSFWKDVIKGDLRRKAGIAIKTLPLTYQTQLPVIELCLKLMEIEQQAGATGDAQEAMLHNIQIAMESFKWVLGAEAAAKTLSENPKQDHDGGVAELRTPAMIAKASGHPMLMPPIAAMETARFPTATIVPGAQEPDE